MRPQVFTASGMGVVTPMKAIGKHNVRPDTPTSRMNSERPPRSAHAVSTYRRAA